MAGTKRIFSAKTFFLAAVLALAAAGLSGCAGIAVGGAAAVGTAAYQERGIEGVARDMATATKVRVSLLNAGEEYITILGIEVYEGRVLLTGAMADEGKRAEAVRIVWKSEGVKDVINEIQFTETDLRDLAKDSWVTTQLKTKITFDKKIHAINYSVETVNAVVYLIGIAQSAEELNRVLTHARDINYVRRVISHVWVKKGKS